MKYLSEYINDATSEVLREYKGFFAFSDKQLEEAKKENGLTDEKLISLPSGIICPSNNALKLIEALNDVMQAGIKQDIEENGIDNIIRRELSNHEAYYTMDISSTIDALAGYDIQDEQVLKILTLQLSKNND